MKSVANIRYGLGAAAVIGAMALTGCGSQLTPGSPAAVKAPRSSLTIAVAAAHGAVPRRWTLTCDPAGGTHPDAQAACAVLSTVKDPFAPVPPHIMCPMIASGPQVASITGDWEGHRVSASYSRDNGCQTTRWEKLAKVLGGVNPGGPMIPAGATPGKVTNPTVNPAATTGTNAG
jgi:Subtilisin inhibitor-like